jgi:hypothetical protein
MRDAVGIDVGSQSCRLCVCTSDKDLVSKPTAVVTAAPGFALVHAKLASLGVPPGQVVVGLEATSR